MALEEVPLPAGAVLRPVRADQWSVVAWLWQAFRQDLSPVVGGLPHPDGRYGAVPLRDFPSPDGAGHLAWRPHPNTGEDAPVAFALVSGLQADRRSMAAFWVAPPLRRTGLGTAVALAVLEQHPGPWEIGFQHDNPSAGGVLAPRRGRGLRAGGVDRDGGARAAPSPRAARSLHPLGGVTLREYPLGVLASAADE